MATLGVGVYLGSQVFAQQGGAGNHPSTSAEPLRTRIAVVNLVQVLKKYSKFQSCDAELKQQITKAKEGLDPLEKQIRALQAKAQLPETPAADRETIKRDLERLTLQYREKAEDADKAFMKRSGELAVQIYKEVEDTVETFARHNAIELVLMYNDALKSQPAEFYSAPYVQQRLKMPNAVMPLYVDPRMDITEAIAQMLNRRVSG
jgi:Skp family chaperone for outer membrane proteins